MSNSRLEFVKPAIMIKHSQTSWIHLPLCASCGRRGEELATIKRCPDCDCDFSLRIPRSYAQMEGLDSAHEVALVSNFVKVNRRWSMEQRLLVGFLTILAAVGLAGMVATFLS